MQARPSNSSSSSRSSLGMGVTNTRTQHNCRTLDVVFLWPHALPQNRKPNPDQMTPACKCLVTLSRKQPPSLIHLLLPTHSQLYLP